MGAERRTLWGICGVVLWEWKWGEAEVHVRHPLHQSLVSRAEQGFIL